MTTAKQAEANKANAKKSTGPTSSGGKANSSKNALKHGGCAALGLLPDEDPAEFDRHIRETFTQYAPCGPDQHRLVELIADGWWRLRRFSRAEAGILTWYAYERIRKRLDEQAGSSTPPEGSIGQKKARLRAKQADIDYAAQAFLADAMGADVLSKLSRYETTMLNRTLRAMKELRELRACQIEPMS